MRPFHSIYTRFVLSFIGIVLISIITAFVVTLFFYRETIQEEITNQIGLAGETLSTSLELQQPSDLGDFFSPYEEAGFRMVLLNGETTLYDSGGETLPYTFDELSGEEGVIQGDELFRDNKVYFVTQVAIGEEEYAFFIEPTNFGPLENGYGILIRSLAIVLMIGSILIIFGTRFVIRPINELSQVAQDVANGNFKARVKRRQKDEIGQLMENVNRMVEELEKTEQMRTEFVSNVSHEIQTPLTSLKGYLKAMKDGVIPHDEQEFYLQLMVEETERLSNLGDYLLKLATLDAERYPFHPTDYRLDEQLRNVVIKLQPVWEGSFEIEAKLDQCTVFADKDLMELVWINLLSNSFHYSKPGTKITISLTSTDEHWQVAIQDQGIGIKEEDQQRIFERFYKADKARVRTKAGNGLGLSIVKKIIQLHQAEIRIESRYGKGTTMTIEQEKKGHVYTSH